MKTDRPSRLTVPAIEAHPFITVVNSILNLGMKHQADDTHWPDLSGDADFSVDNFEHPGCVQPYSLAPIQAMTSKTFSKLCAVLKPTFLETEITSQDSLADAAMIHAHRFEDDEDVGEFTLDQLQGYIMHNAVIQTDVPWASLAELYNESIASQQEALHQFFIRCRNRNLEVLMDVPAPTLGIPEGFSETLPSKVEDGQIYLLSKSRQAWLREDVFQQQYQVHGVHNNNGITYLLGAAPTLREAVGKASAYANKASGSMVLDYIAIKHLGSYLAKATFDFVNDADLGEMLVSPVTLRWNMDYPAERTRQHDAKIKTLGSEMTLAKDLRIVDQLQAQVDEIQAQIDAMHLPKREDFKRLVFSVEKALGLQWTKVKQLEDDLGM